LTFPYIPFPDNTRSFNGNVKSFLGCLLSRMILKAGSMLLIWACGGLNYTSILQAEWVAGVEIRLFLEPLKRPYFTF
jgi:hypothetical protein